MKILPMKLKACVLAWGMSISIISGAASFDSTLLFKGVSEITLSSRSGRAHVVLHIRSSAQQSHRNCETTIVSEVPFSTSVELMEISVGNRTVIVPRSAYADLYAPREAAIHTAGRTFILEISGGDGADSYSVQIYFDAKRVFRRKIFGTIFDGGPTADTRYYLRIL